MERCTFTALTTASLGGVLQRGLGDGCLLMDTRGMVELIDVFLCKVSAFYIILLLIKAVVCILWMQRLGVHPPF